MPTFLSEQCARANQPRTNRSGSRTGDPPRGDTGSESAQKIAPIVWHTRGIRLLRIRPTFSDGSTTHAPAGLLFHDLGSIPTPASRKPGIALGGLVQLAKSWTSRRATPI